jgi:hypothetical protein
MGAVRWVRCDGCGAMGAVRWVRWDGCGGMGAVRWVRWDGCGARVSMEVVSVVEQYGSLHHLILI